MLTGGAGGEDAGGGLGCSVEVSMRLMVVVLALMLAGVAVGQEAEPFPFTPEQMDTMKPNTPEEATFAGWLFRNADSERVKKKGYFGAHKEAGVVVAGAGLIDHTDKMAKAEAGNKLAALEVTLYAVEKEHTPNPMYIKVQCEGSVYEVSMMASAPKPKLGTTSVMPGESTRGWVIVEVPATATAETCKWAWDVPVRGRTAWLNIIPPPKPAPK